MKLASISEGLLGLKIDPAMSPKAGPGLGLSPKTMKAYGSPKFARIVSEKLSRLIDLDVVILLSSQFFHSYEKIDRATRELIRVPDRRSDLSKLTGVPESNLAKSLIVIINHDNDQTAVTPWMIVHQIAESLSRYDVDMFKEIGVICNRYAASFTKLNNSYGKDDLDWRDTTMFRDVFRMRSARTASAPIPQDPVQELITEYLWHGRHIRTNYPEGVERQVVDDLRGEIEGEIAASIERMLGVVMYNSI